MTHNVLVYYIAETSANSTSPIAKTIVQLSDISAPWSAMKCAIADILKLPVWAVVSLYVLPTVKECEAVRSDNKAKRLLKRLATKGTYAGVFQHYGICYTLDRRLDHHSSRTIIWMMRTFDYALPSSEYFCEDFRLYSVGEKWEGTRGELRKKFCRDAYEFFFGSLEG